MKRALRNVFGVMLLSLAIVVTQIPVKPAEAANDASEFQLDGSTLVKYTGTASTVSVPDTVKKIGEEAFADNTNVNTVKIPKGVETIAYGAFSYCTQLKKVSLPDTIVTIGNAAFANCTSLSSISLGAEVESLGTGVFAGCTSLKNVTINKNNSRYTSQKGVIYDKEQTVIYQYCPGKTDASYSMPSTVKDIKKYAFWGCENLKKVTLNTDFAAIPEYAFSNCRSLEEIMLSYAVKSIEAKAFEDCVGLTSLELPPSINRIHETAFDGCNNLTLNGDEGTIAGDFAGEFNAREKSVQAEYEDIHNQEEITNQNTQQEEPVVAEESSQSESQDAGILLGSSTVVGNQAVVFIDNSAQTINSGGQPTENQAGEVSVNGPKAEGEELPESGGTAQNAESENDGKGIRISKYILTKDGILADQAFYKDRGLTAYTIPQGTTQIGEFSFARSGLTAIDIPEGVTEIGYGAFYHCDDLNQISLPSTIEKVAPEAFEKTGWIENWKKSGSSKFLTAGNGILFAYNGTEANVIVPEGISMIAPNVFKGHTEINTVVLPDSVLRVGEGAFEGCTNLSQVSGGTYLKHIEDRAFAGCPLDTARIPDGIESIGLRAFDFTGTDKSQDEKTAVFHGTIPQITYEKTAQRLSNEEYRQRALNDVSFAAINMDVGMDALQNTVLDGSLYGFKGVIVSIDSETDKTAVVRGTTLTEEELAYFEMPATIEIYGRQYILSGNGQLSELASANEGSGYQNDGTVLIMNKVAEMDTGSMSASLGSGAQGAYYLSISKSDEAFQRLSDAYRFAFEAEPPANLKAFDLSLYEEESKVSIEKLGRQAVTVTMPIPAGLENGTLYILCSDANGQLEDVAYRLNTSGETPTVTFSTGHFSDFGFYSLGGGTLYAESRVSGGQAVVSSYSVLDDSPDTGDGLHPKWFLAGGLLFAALALFFYKKAPKLHK